jgi:DNA replication protein DnaC
MIDFARSKCLNNIPDKKLKDAIESIENSADDAKVKYTKLIAVNRYYESNIPIEYWSKKIERDWVGDPNLLAKYNEYVSDLKASYVGGKSIFFQGTHGVGKSFVSTSILKKACLVGYNVLYTTLSDVVSILTSASNEEKYLARRELTLVDFLALDEVDNRFFNTESSADLYARSLESVLRTRAQNKLPTIMCTNSPNIVNSLNGSMKSSIDSLMSGHIEKFVVIGKDIRKEKP